MHCVMSRTLELATHGARRPKLSTAPTSMRNRLPWLFVDAQTATLIPPSLGQIVGAAPVSICGNPRRCRFPPPTAPFFIRPLGSAAPFSSLRAAWVSSAARASLPEAWSWWHPGERSGSC